MCVLIWLFFRLLNECVLVYCAVGVDLGLGDVVVIEGGVFLFLFFGRGKKEEY